jgi:hypothetical protein
MSSDSAPSATPDFDLIIEIAGLCLYADPKSAPGSKLGLIMPDGRVRPSTTPPTVPYPDGRPSVPHTAYLRFDVANLVSGLAVPAARPDHPSYEVVHLFTGEELSFDIVTPGGTMAGTPLVPDFKRFAPDLVARGDLFSADPTKKPAGVAMRSVLHGGEIHSKSDNVQWILAGTYNSGVNIISSYSGTMTWMRTFKGARGLDVILTDFTSGAVTTIPLAATARGAGQNDAVKLKIANLCATNPLEWEELNLHAINAADRDFKWMYTLIENLPANPQLPFPVPLMSNDEGELQDCFGARIQLDF